jgi:hypothetical protein
MMAVHTIVVSCSPTTARSNARALHRASDGATRLLAAEHLGGAAGAATAQAKRPSWGMVMGKMDWFKVNLQISTGKHHI